MEAAIFHKNLNDVFEELYFLFSKTFSNENYMTKNTDIENCVSQFKDIIRIECFWDMTFEERQGFGKSYFQVWDNDNDAVYYPFYSSTTKIDLVKIKQILYIWKKTIECIQKYNKENYYYDIIFKVNQSINNSIDKINLALI